MKKLLLLLGVLVVSQSAFADSLIKYDSKIDVLPGDDFPGIQTPKRIVYLSSNQSVTWFRDGVKVKVGKNYAVEFYKLGDFEESKNYHVANVVAKLGEVEQSLDLVQYVDNPGICKETSKECQWIRYKAGTLSDISGFSGIYNWNNDGGHAPWDSSAYSQIVFTAEYSKINLKHHQLLILRNASVASLNQDDPKSVMSMHMAMGGTEDYRNYTSNQFQFNPALVDSGEDSGLEKFPARWNYTVASVGHSGSEDDDMRNFAFIAAALRKDVRQFLTARGLVIATIQAIDKEARYGDVFHPLANAGAADKYHNTIKAVKLANDITLDTLPPVARLRLVTGPKEIPNIMNYGYGRTVIVNTPGSIGFAQTEAQTIRIDVADSYSPIHPGAELEYNFEQIQGPDQSIMVMPVPGSHTQFDITFLSHGKEKIARKSESGNDIYSYLSVMAFGVREVGASKWSTPVYLSSLSIR